MAARWRFGGVEGGTPYLRDLARDEEKRLGNALLEHKTILAYDDDDANGSLTLVPLHSSAQLTIGRDASCDVRFTSRKVSHLQACIEARAGSWYLEDRSTYGTKINNGWSSRQKPLRDGDVLGLGPVQVQFRDIRDRSSTEGSADAPLDNGFTSAQRRLLVSLCAPRLNNEPDPSIKALAEQVHLSRDGVQGALTGLYRRFGIGGPRRGKMRELITLLIERGYVTHTDLQRYAPQ